MNHAAPWKGDGALPPGMSQVAHLQPSDVAGAGYVALTLSLTFAGGWAAWHGGVWLWLVSQPVLALAFIQWFILLHEAGHNTLFKSRKLNLLSGHLASIFAMIPYESWRRIHARHHRWTGWQDLDATTVSLTPRPRRAWELRIVNAAWGLHLPLFSVLYRIENYWNIRRLGQYLPPNAVRKTALQATTLLLCYAAAFSLAEAGRILSAFGPALALSFAFQDPLLLSQHTHIPQNLSGGRRVRPFSPFDQQAYTRSLRFPGWFSWLILHFDAHELHHMYVPVPGYRLREIPFQPSNEVNWWTWLCAAKRLPGEVFLFQNRTQTGFSL